MNEWISNEQIYITEARHPRSLSLRIEDGIEYVTFPPFRGVCSGYVKIRPKLEKAPKITAYSMVSEIQPKLMKQLKFQLVRGCFNSIGCFSIQFPTRKCTQASTWIV